jgi:hypothetical protein
VDGLLRHVGDAEDAAIDELELEERHLLGLGVALDGELDLELLLAHRIGVDVDLDVDRRLVALRHQRARRVAVLEGEVAHVLRQHVELRGRFEDGFAGRVHGKSPVAPQTGRLRVQGVAWRAR